MKSNKVKIINSLGPSRIRSTLAVCAVVIMFIAIVGTATLMSSELAYAVENITTTAQVNTTTTTRTDALNRGAQIGNVTTQHRAQTTLTYPLNVRAGQTFNYTRCVKSVYLAENTVYEVSIDRVSIDSASSSFAQIYTQTSTTKALNICTDYTATAPAAGASSLTIPSATVTSYGGIGYAGSCCPTWGLSWAYTTTDNTLNFDNVYTAPSAQNDGVFELEANDTYRTAPLVNDAGFVGGLGTKLGTPTSHSIATQATKGTCVWDGNEIVYTNTGTHGFDSCVYRLNQAETDGLSPGNEATQATINFLINNAPSAQDDSGYETPENSSITLDDVLDNDSDPNNDELAIISLVKDGDKGSTSFNGDEITFDPGVDFDYLGVGDEEIISLTYTVQDEFGATDSAQVFITILGRYDHVIAFNDTVEVDADKTITFDARSNDFADQNNPFWIRSVDGTGILGEATRTNDSIKYDPQGQFDYLNDGESATETFTYKISDDIFPGVFSQASITITINGVNDGPRLVDDEVDVTVPNSVTFNPLDNDNDVDMGDSIELDSAVLNGDDGSISISGDEITFDPGTDFVHVSINHFRTVTITYVVRDLGGATSSAIIRVNVYGQNEAPTANADELAAQDRKTPTIDVLANDTDPDSDDTLTITSVVPTGTFIGTLKIENGIVRWIVGDSYFALLTGETLSQTFEYTISDGNGGISTSTGVINLTRTVDNVVDNDDNGIPDWFELDYEQERAENPEMQALVLPSTLEACPAHNDLLNLVSGKMGAGEKIEVSGKREWLANSTVTYFVCSTPTLLTKTNANSDGFAATDLRLPRDLTNGTHMIVGIGLSPDGEVLLQTYSAKSFSSPNSLGVLGSLGLIGSLAHTGVSQVGHLLANISAIVISGFALLAGLRLRKNEVF